MPDLRKAFNKATNSVTPHDKTQPSPRTSSDISDDENHPEKYLLQVTAGPSYNAATHQEVHVNGDEPTSFESDAMSVKVRVRIQGYNGLPRGSPETSSYFQDPEHKSSLYSISFSFIPKRTLPSADLVWGNDFDHPLRDRLPPGFNTAFRIVKQFIDPGLECDAYADEPWLYGPALSCWFALNIGEKDSSALSNALKDDKSIVFEGGEGSGHDIRSELGLPDTVDKRRKFFLDREHMEKFSFEQGRLYEGDFHNPYLDFSNYALKLPGFSLGVLKYIGDKTHTLRYVFKDRKTGEVFFVVVITLLFGQQLHEVLGQDKVKNRDYRYNQHDVD